MKLVGYVRVSTPGQVEDGFGLDVQRAALAAWAKQEGHRLVRVESDEGVSGTLPAQERPGLADALAAVREGRVQGLVVHRLDRLARLLAVQEATLAVLWKYEAHVFEVASGEVLRDDPDDPMRTAMRQMFGVFSQLERATVVARMRAGRRVKASRGGYAGGAPAFGHAAKDRELVEDAQEQAAIRRARQLRMEGGSLREIALALADEGHTAKRGGAWHPETLRRLLDRDRVRR